MSKVKEERPVAEGSPPALWELLTGALYDRTKYLDGQLCTFVDSTTADERQAKAAKDIVRTLLWAYEKKLEKSIECYLARYFYNPKIAIFPCWLEKQVKKEYS